MGSTTSTPPEYNGVREKEEDAKKEYETSRTHDSFQWALGERGRRYQCVEPGTSLSLSKEAKAAIGKLVNAMSPVCALYDVDFRDLVAEHVMEAGKDIFGKVDFDMADPPYNVRRERNTANSEYNVFNLQDMKDMVEHMGRRLKPGAHGDIFCSSLQFALWYKAFTSKKKEVQSSQMRTPRGRILRWREAKGKEMEVVTRTLWSSRMCSRQKPLHYRRAVGNYHQTTAAKMADHT